MKDAAQASVYWVYDMENAFWVKQKYLKDVRSTIENISNNTCNTSIDH